MKRERLVGLVKVMGGNAVVLKQMNRTAILNLLLKNSPLTKADIAAESQLTFATVSNLISEMQVEDLIIEMGHAESNGGRKPALYGVNPQAFAFVGIDLQVEKIVCALTDFEGNLVYSDSMVYRVEDGPFHAVKVIRALVDHVLISSKTPFSKVRGIGVSAPGPINNTEGVIISPPNMPGWRNVPLRDLVAKEFNLPCYLEKDANAAALGEARYGVGKGLDDLLYIMVDVGIGGGIVIGNQVYRGFLNGAGEIGHTMIHADGPKCNCGNNGCLEALASGLAIERDLFEELGEDVKLDRLFDKAFEHKAVLDRHLTQAGRYLGIAVANVCNTLNMPLVILGGSIVEHSDLYFEEAKEVARSRILPDFAQRIQIMRSKLGCLAGAVGAATMVLQDLIYKTA